MSNLRYCRRTFITTLAILCLTALGIHKGMDVAMAIAAVAGALSASNAYEKRGAANVIKS